VLEFRVRARVRVKVMAMIRDSWGTKRIDTNYYKKFRVRNIWKLV